MFDRLNFGLHVKQNKECKHEKNDYSVARSGDGFDKRKCSVKLGSKVG
jgi:hypothetical protein